MKVKIFSRGNETVDQMENNINKFIETNKVISITQSESIDNENGLRSLTITVLYEELGISHDVGFL